MSIGFVVTDLDRVVAGLTAAGVTFTREENEADRFAFFRDADETPLYLFGPNRP